MYKLKEHSSPHHKTSVCGVNPSLEGCGPM